MTPAELGRKWLDAWNDGTVSTIVGLFAEGGTYNDPIVRRAISTTELAEYTKVWAGFADMTLSPLSITADDEKAAVEWEMTGTHSGTFLGHPPSGKQVRLTGISLVRARGDRIASVQDYWDLKTLLDQLTILDVPVK
jgi:steroid delta-isomerase-like uncharacterized protein